MASTRNAQKLMTTTLQFGVDVTQYLCVNFNLTTGVLQLPRVEGHRAVGVTQEAVDFSVNPYGKVATLGHTKVVAGGTILAGDAVMAQTTGKVIVATGANVQVGIAMQSAVATDVFEILLVPGGESSVS